MAEVRTIKGIDKETWEEFRKIAKRNKTTGGALLKKMIANYRTDTKKEWDILLNSKKVLSEEGAKNMEKIWKENRKEKGFRNK